MSPAPSARRGLLASAGLALFLLAMVFYLEFHRPSQEAARAEAAARLGPSAGEIESILIEGRAAPFTLRSSSEGWELLSASGKTHAVDTAAVAAVLASLRTGRLRELLSQDPLLPGTIEGDSPALEAMGLLRPIVTLTWSAGNESLRLALGRPIPFEPSRLHALANGRLVSVPLQLLTSVTRWDELHFRARTIFPLKRKDIQGIDVWRRFGLAEGEASRLSFSRDRHVAGRPLAWRMDLPQKVRANVGRLGAACSQLAGLQAEAFGPDDPSLAQLEERGLSPATVELVLVLDGGARGKLLLGDLDEESGLVWAHAGKGPLILLAPSLKRDFLGASAGFRDQRALLPHRREALRGLLIESSSVPAFRLALLKDEQGEWLIDGSPRADAQGLILGLLDALADVRFAQFKDDASGPFGGLDSLRLEFQAGEGRRSGQALVVEVAGAVLIDNQAAFLPVLITDRAGRSEGGLIDAMEIPELLVSLRRLVELFGEDA